MGTSRHGGVVVGKLTDLLGAYDKPSQEVEVEKMEMKMNMIEDDDMEGCFLFFFLSLPLPLYLSLFLMNQRDVVVLVVKCGGCVSI